MEEEILNEITNIGTELNRIEDYDFIKYRIHSLINKSMSLYLLKKDDKYLRAVELLKRANNNLELYNIKKGNKVILRLSIIFNKLNIILGETSSNSNDDTIMHKIISVDSQMNLIISIVERYRLNGFFKRSEIKIILNTLNNILLSIFSVSSEFNSMEYIIDIFPESQYITREVVDNIRRDIIELIQLFSSIEIENYNWRDLRDKHYKVIMNSIIELKAFIIEFVVNMRDMMKNYTIKYEEFMKTFTAEDTGVFEVRPSSSRGRNNTNIFNNSRRVNIQGSRRTIEERHSQVLNYLRNTSEGRGKTIDQISSSLGINREYVAKICKKLFNKHLLKRVKDGNRYRYWISNKGIDATNNMAGRRTRL